MSSDLEKALEEIQKVMWSDYSEIVIDHAQNPRNMGGIENADGEGTIKGPCGDTMHISLKVKDGNITNAGFQTDGCGTTVASGSMITEMARGKRVAEALKISQQDVLDALGDLPEDSVHCALLASNTLKEAVKDYMSYRNEPWKRTYRKKE